MAFSTYTFAYAFHFPRRARNGANFYKALVACISFFTLISRSFGIVIDIALVSPSRTHRVCFVFSLLLLECADDMRDLCAVPVRGNFGLVANKIAIN